jgi:hypothetical protein
MADKATRQADGRLSWIYLIRHETNQPCGMRCWYGMYRCDIAFREGKFEYWISECWNSERDVYWTHSRYSDDVFAAMADGEKWIREMQDTLDFREEDDEG